jgi:hypothetical protein
MESLPPWGIAVLDRGLKDRHVYVCEWAVRKIGEDFFKYYGNLGASHDA